MFLPKTIMSPDQLNQTVIDFHNQLLMMALVNSGTSYGAEKRNEFTEKAFAISNKILSDAFKRKDIKLFNRIYTESKRLVAGPYVTPEMRQIQENFEANAVAMIQDLKMYIATNGRLSR